MLYHYLGDLLHYFPPLRAMVPTSILLMSTMKGNGMLARGQDGAGCTTLMDQCMKESGTMTNVMEMAC